MRVAVKLGEREDFGRFVDYCEGWRGYDRSKSCRGDKTRHPPSLARIDRYFGCIEIARQMLNRLDKSERVY